MPSGSNCYHMVDVYYLKRGKNIMLSQENIDKLCMTGLYRTSPDFIGFRGSDPYWCRNWTFRVFHDDLGNYCMNDTYWSSNSNSFSLTDENFNKFELLFDLNEVEEYKMKNILDYAEEDRWMGVPMDSGGWRFPKNFIRKGSMPVKERVVARLKDEIERVEFELKDKKRMLQRVENDEIDLKYVL